jgi:hypothetical protein
MFGVETKVGLTSSSLPDEIISKISTGDDLKVQGRFGWYLLLHICPVLLHIEHE